MVYRFYGKYGELARIKLWTKTGERELPRTIRLEHHPVKNEVIAYVRCAVVEQVSYNYAGVTNFMEVEHPICVAEKYNELLTSEEFKKKGKEVPTMEEPKPTTKICPYCLSEINIGASRCPHCTSVLEEKESEVIDEQISIS